MKIKYGVTVKGVELFADVAGLDGLVAALGKMPAVAREAAASSLTECALDLQGKATARAPVDTGALRGSSFTTPANASHMTAEVGFGLQGTKQYLYALRQHEELGWKHSKGGEAQYLINPFRENLETYIKRIGAAIRKAVTGG